MKEGLPEECQRACSCAISKLEDVTRQLQTGAITILDLQEIKREQQQMKRLCQSASAQQKEASKSVEMMTYETMVFRVAQRIQEFESFRQQQGILLNLCLKIHQEIKGRTYPVSLYLHGYIKSTACTVFIIWHVCFVFLWSNTVHIDNT